MSDDEYSKKKVFSMFFPALVILNLSLVFLFIYPLFLTSSEQNSPDYFQRQQIGTVNEHVKSLDSFYERISSISDTIRSYAEDLFNSNPSTFRTSYFHNYSVSGVPPNFIFSPKHGQNVSYDVSAFKLAPNEYNNPVTPCDESSTFEDWSQDIENDINLTSNLDLIYSPLYASMEEILWVYIGFESGLHRTYPHHPLPCSYDPRIRPWYTDTFDLSVGKTAFSTPFVDAATGNVIITASQSIFNITGSRLGVIGIDFNLETIQREVLAGNIGDSGRHFLITTDSFIVSHPLYKTPDVPWNATDLDQSICNNAYESDSSEFCSLIDLAKTSVQPVQEVIDYGDPKGEQLVTLLKLNSSSFIFGIALDYSGLFTEVFASGFSFEFPIILLIVDVLIIIGIFFGPSVVSTLRSQGIFKKTYYDQKEPEQIIRDSTTTPPEKEEVKELRRELDLDSFKAKPNSSFPVNEQQAILFGVPQIIPITKEFVNNQFLNIFSNRRSLMLSELPKGVKEEIENNLNVFLNSISEQGQNLDEIDYNVLLEFLIGFTKPFVNKLNEQYGEEVILTKDDLNNQLTSLKSSKTYDIFLSYSRNDWDKVEKILAFFDKKGIHCWIDKDDIAPGSKEGSWKAKILDGIGGAKNYLLVLTENSNASEFVVRELQFAKEEKLNLFCICFDKELYDDKERLNKDIRFDLASIQIDFVTDDSMLETELEKIAKNLSK
ncbi:MAG: TIR domain-containing protein [Candidatus Hodarchaeales archaeon]|jgi:hypothetical protein